MSLDPGLLGARGQPAGPLHPPRPLRRRHPDGGLPGSPSTSTATPGSGRFLFYVLQAGHHAHPVLAANTSFTGFPFLASFAADDSYLPRQLTRRGHRLVFSTGIIVLTVVPIVLLLVTPGPGRRPDRPLRHRRVHRLHHGRRGHGQVPPHATGRPTGAAGRSSTGPRPFLVVHRRPHHRLDQVQRGGVGDRHHLPLAVLVVLLPAAPRVRGRGRAARGRGGPGHRGADPASPRGHRARRPARPGDGPGHPVRARPSPPTTCGRSTSTSTPRRPGELEEEWSRLGLSRLPLDIVECPDRRLGRAAIELVADAVADGDTECTVLLPRRGFAIGWQRLPPRPHGRQDRRGGGPGAPRERHHRPLPPERLAGPSAAAATARSSRGAGGGRRRAARARRLRPSDRPGPSGRPAPGAGHGGSAPVSRRPGPGRLRVGRHTPIGRGPLPRAGAGGRAGPVGAGPAPGRHLQPRVRADRRDRGHPPRLPGPAPDPGHRARGPSGGRGHGGAWGRRLAILNPDYELVAGSDGQLGPEPGSRPADGLPCLGGRRVAIVPSTSGGRRDPASPAAARLGCARSRQPDRCPAATVAVRVQEREREHQA